MNRRAVLAAAVASVIGLAGAEAKGDRYRYFKKKSRPGVIYLLDTAREDEQAVTRKLLDSGWKKISKREAGKVLGKKRYVDQAKPWCLCGYVKKYKEGFACDSPEVCSSGA